MIKPSALVLAGLISSRSLWLAFVDHAMPVADAVIWFLVAVPVAALIIAGLSSLMNAYRKANQPARAEASDGLVGADDA